MHSGKGVAATRSAAEALGQMVPKFAEHTAALQAGMRKLGIAWSGQAATAATTKLQQAASWAEQAGQTSTAGHASVQTYGDSFANTVPHIPEPKPEPDTGAWGKFEDFFDMQQDKWDNLAENQKNNQLAVAALDRHEQITREAANSFPDQLDPQFHTADAGVTHSAAAGPAPGSSGAGTPGEGHSAGAAETRATSAPGMTAPNGAGTGRAAATARPGGATGREATGPGGTGTPGSVPPSSWTPLTPRPLGPPDRPGSGSGRDVGKCRLGRPRFACRPPRPGRHWPQRARLGRRSR